jgi:hypothetical protein
MAKQSKTKHEEGRRLTWLVLHHAAPGPISLVSSLFILVTFGGWEVLRRKTNHILPPSGY